VNIRLSLNESLVNFSLLFVGRTKTLAKADIMIKNYLCALGLVIVLSLADPAFGQENSAELLDLKQGAIEADDTAELTRYVTEPNLPTQTSGTGYFTSHKLKHRHAFKIVDHTAGQLPKDPIDAYGSDASTAVPLSDKLPSVKPSPVTSSRRRSSDVSTKR